MAHDGTVRDLRKQDFRSQPLAGADFERCDVRGADFSGADLTRARFSHARLGVPPGRGALILVGGLAIAIAAGVMIGWAIADTTGSLASSEADRIAEGASLVFLFAVFIGLVVWRGFDVAGKVTAITYVVVVIVNLAGNLLFDRVEWVRLARFTVVVIALLLAVLTGILGRVVGGVFGSWSIAVVALAGGVASGRANGGIGGILVALSLVFIAKRAMRGDRRDQRLRSFGHRLARRWGTNFVDADLTEADFTGTNVAGSDMRGAILDGVRWEPTHPPPADIAR